MWDPFKKIWTSLKKEGGGLFGRHEHADAEEEEVKIPIQVERFLPDEQPAEEQRPEPAASTESYSEPKEEEFVPVEDKAGGGIITIGEEEAAAEPVEKPQPGLKKAVRWLSLILIGLIPVFFLPFTAPADVLILSKQILVMLLTVAALVIWLIMTIKQGAVFLKRTPLVWGVLAVLVAGLLTALFSLRPYQSFLGESGFLTLLWLALFFMVLINFFEKEDVGRIINVFVLGSVAAVLAGLLTILGVPIWKWINILLPQGVVFGGQFNVVGSFGSLGALASLLLILVIARHLETGNEKGIEEAAGGWQKKFWPAVYWTGTIVFSWFILMLNWRALYAVTLAGAAGLILMPFLARWIAGQRIKLKPAHLIVPLAVAVLSLVFLSGARYFGFDVSGTVLGKNVPVEVSLSQKSSWTIAEKVFNHYPVFGLGQDNFILAYEKFKPTSINNTPFWNAPFAGSASAFFNLSIQQGALGLAAGAFFLFLIFYQVLALKKREADLFGLDILRKVLPAFLAILVLGLMSSFNLTLMAGFWILAALITLGLSRGDKKGVRMDDISLFSIASSLAFVLILVVGLVSVYLCFQKYGGQVYLAKAVRITGEDRKAADKSIELLKRAAEIDGNNEAVYSNLAVRLLQRINLEVNDSKLSMAEIRERVKGFNDQAVRTAMAMVDGSRQQRGANWFNAGYVYENLVGIVDNADAAAIRAYSEYLSRVPGDPNGYVRLGRVYLRRADRNAEALSSAKKSGLKVENEEEVVRLIIGDYQKAEENLKKAVELKGDLAIALYSLGMAYERQNKVKEAIGQLETIRTGLPNDPNLAFELALLYYRDGRRRQAIMEMGRAIQLFPEFSNARWYLALLLEEEGKMVDALAQLQAIASLEVNKDNQVLLSKIASLKAGIREIPPAKVTSKEPLETKQAVPQR